MIGETIHGRYSVVRLIGAGRMGNVYEATHTGTGRRVAIKVITGDLTKHPDLVERFGREARAAGVLESQHIAQVLDVGEDAGRPFLVMELLQGEDLEHLFTRLGALPPNLAVCIAAQACIGLAKAHASGILHRDIEPGNLFLARRDGGEQVVKLLDFGIAKLKMDEGQGMGLTGTGARMGTPRYMSPEQARGDKEIDFRADLWSLGVVLYRALTGKTPHHEIDAPGALLLAICGGAGTPVQELAPWVDPDIVAVVDKALARSAADRFQTADEMHQALRAVANGGETTLQAAAVVPMTAAERAFVALPATVRASDIPSQPSLPPEPRGPSQPAIVITPPVSSHRASAHGATLTSANTIDSSIPPLPAGPSTTPPPSRGIAAPSSRPPRQRTPRPRATLAPLLLGGVAIVGLVIAGLAHFISSAPAASPAADNVAKTSAEAAPLGAVAPTLGSAPGAPKPSSEDVPAASSLPSAMPPPSIDGGPAGLPKGERRVPGTESSHGPVKPL